MKIYTCVCGKTFDNPQKFNGHKSNCKEHILTKYESVSEYYKNKTPVINKGAELAKQRSFDRLNIWVSEQHTCEKCGKVMTEKFGSGRFCSRSCANGRPHTEESKLKTRVSAYKNLGVEEADISEYKAKKTLSKKQHNNNKWLKQEQLKQQKLQDIEFLNNHNKTVLEEYTSILLNLAKDKIEQYPEVQFESAKYIATIMPEHPRSYQDGVVFLHVLIAEQLLGRSLSKDEIVHHVDHNKHNNIFSNFYIFDSKGSHACFHYAKKPCLNIVGDVLNCFAFHNDKDLHEWVVENSL